MGRQSRGASGREGACEGGRAVVAIHQQIQQGVLRRGFDTGTCVLYIVAR